MSRVRENAATYTRRTDKLNVGKRVRAVLPMDISTDGKLIYKDANGKFYTEENLWSAVGLHNPQKANT